VRCKQIKTQQQQQQQQPCNSTDTDTGAQKKNKPKHLQVPTGSYASGLVGASMRHAEWLCKTSRRLFMSGSMTGIQDAFPSQKVAQK